MDHATVATSADECFRCGYNLYSIPNENACPECGLLAERSRRSTQELHDTHPRWLRNIHWGLNLILFSAVAVVAWPICIWGIGMVGINFLGLTQNSLTSIANAFWPESLPLVFGGPATFLFFLGVFFLTQPERYAPADQADHKRRLTLCFFAAIPLALLILSIPLGLLLRILNPGTPPASQFLTQLIQIIFQITLPMGIALILAPLPFLLFTHLRALAIRAHCAYLPHDCLVLGIGMAGMIVGLPALIISQQFGFGSTWAVNQVFGMIFGLFIFLVCVFFLIWAVYLLVNFSLTFGKLRRDLRKRWKLDDFSLPFKDSGNSQA